MKIYLIDDDPNILNFLKLIIQAKNLGEICGICTSPIDALEDLKYIKPDIVVIDLLMPGMDGISFVRKTASELQETAYIMLSQVSNKEMISSAYEAGIEFFIQKPINAIEVESVLTRVSQSLAMKRTLNSMQNLFLNQMQDIMPKATAAPPKESPHVQKTKDILQRLGLCQASCPCRTLCQRNLPRGYACINSIPISLLFIYPSQKTRPLYRNSGRVLLSFMSPSGMTGGPSDGAFAARLCIITSSQHPHRAGHIPHRPLDQTDLRVRHSDRKAG